VRSQRQRNLVGHSLSLEAVVAFSFVCVGDEGADI
jgi:hypothetical protein